MTGFTEQLRCATVINDVKKRLFRLSILIPTYMFRKERPLSYRMESPYCFHLHTFYVAFQIIGKYLLFINC